MRAATTRKWSGLLMTSQSVPEASANFITLSGLIQRRTLVHFMGEMLASYELFAKLVILSGLTSAVDRSISWVTCCLSGKKHRHTERSTAVKNEFEE
jgi:hypothetical protein